MSTEENWTSLLVLLRSAAKHGARATVEIDGEDCALLIAALGSQQPQNAPHAPVEASQVPQGGPGAADTGGGL